MCSIPVGVRSMSALTKRGLSLLLLVLFSGLVAVVFSLAAPPSAAAQGGGMFLTAEYVGSIGGAVQAVAVSGDYAYVGQGAGLTILDIRNPTQLVRLSTLPIPDPVIDVFVGAV